MAYSLTPHLGSALQLGTVQNERVTVDAQLFEQPMPGGSASATILIDLFGVVKKIVLQGSFVTGQGGLTIKTFADQFVDQTTGAIKGSQPYSAYVSDSFTTGINVIIVSYEQSWDEGDASRIKYTLTLQEGTVG